MRRYIGHLALVVALAASGCGSGGAGSGSTGTKVPSADVPLLSPRAVPGLDHQDRGLSSATLVREALGEGDISSLLTRWKLQDGAERTFRGTTRDLTSVVSRTLDFGSAQGAAGFVHYVRAHPDSYLGNLKTAQTFSARGRSGFILTAQGCGCHGETPLLLYVASEGSRVTWVMINGPRATTARALRLGAKAP